MLFFVIDGDTLEEPHSTKSYTRSAKWPQNAASLPLDRVAITGHLPGQLTTGSPRRIKFLIENPRTESRSSPVSTTGKIPAARNPGKEQ
jgi:hypothetical protein